MKKLLLITAFIFISTTNSFAMKVQWGEIFNCDSSNVTVMVPAGTFGGAKYLGVTATLDNGQYYDFPAAELSMGFMKTFSLPQGYTASSWEARLWGKMKKSKEPWSDKVVNPQGYLMKDPVTESAICSP